MRIPTLLRQAEHMALKRITLNGSVLDLGGDVRSEYRMLLKGKPSFTVLNLDPKASPDIVHDLEKALPLKDDSYDHVLLINVLEHIYEYRQLLREALRVTKPGGTIVIVVPFLFPIHPSPDDFWRFSKNALRREIEALGGEVVSCEALGSGVCAAQYVMSDRLMPLPVRAFGWYIVRPFVLLADYLFTRIARMTGRKYDPSDYALGFTVIAKRR